ncbi:MAG: sulfotransferase family 2 domain-containing protein [Acidobacteriota bacterium]
MRISHKHRFVFLANPRTASTTIRNILDDYSDIKSRYITDIDRDFPYYHHISAQELKKIFDLNGWDWFSYKRFCIVRNPFDRVVSLYHHKIQTSTQPDERRSRPYNLARKIKYKLLGDSKFENYVKHLNPKKRLTTSLKEFLCDKDGNFLVDDVLMFENLGTELPEYLKQFGIKIEKEDIPHLNLSSGRNKYKEYYDPLTRKKVEEIYSYEIERFKYKFNTGKG